MEWTKEAISSLCDNYKTLLRERDQLIRERDEGLRALAERPYATTAHLRALYKELDEARRDRDNAQLEICNMKIPSLEGQKGFAKGRGWDCFARKYQNA